MRPLLLFVRGPLQHQRLPGQRQRKAEDTGAGEEAVGGELTISRIRIVFQPAKLPNEIAPNCQTILRQIAKFAL